MIKKLLRKFSNIYNKQIDGKGLAIFRITFAIVLLFEVIQLFYFRHLVFDKIPYLIPSEVDTWPVFFFWIICILFIIFGLFTRVSTIINYIFTVIILGTISSYEYHMFYSYLIIGFLIIFLPISKSLSLDRLLLKLKYSNTKFKYNPPQTVSVLAYYLPILLGIAFVYFDSVFFKLTSSLWLNGLGMWLPSSMPQAVFINTSALLNFKYLVIFLGYLTLVFETIFLFTFWRKKWRLPLLIIGIGLHVGILISFPLPFFALGVIAIYLLMVPVSFWQKIYTSKERTSLIFFYDAECPLCNRTRIVIDHFDYRNKIQFLTVQGNALKEPALSGIEFEKLLNDVYSVSKEGKVYSGLDTYIHVFDLIWFFKPISWLLRIPGIYQIGLSIYRSIAVNRTTERCTEDNCGYELPTIPPDENKLKISVNYTLRDLKILGAFFGIFSLVILQIIVTYNSPFFKQVRQSSNISDIGVVRLSEKVSNGVEIISKAFFGITHHGVFMDSHFNNYNHSIAILYESENGEKTWLPIFDPDGTPGNYLFGPIWVKWTFRVNSPLVNQENLIKGIRDFTAFWAGKNNIDLQNANFIILVKKNEDPRVWKDDFLNNQLKNPWLKAGKANWKNNEFTSEILNIEDL